MGKGDLIRKINFPKYVIILAGSFAALINLILNFVVIGAFMAFNHVGLRPVALLLPIIILELFIFSLAVAFFLSTAFVRFRDVSYIWEVTIQGAFYATPILYPLSRLPHSAAKLVMLNPLAQIIQDARYLLVTPQSATIATVYGNRAIRLVPFMTTILIVAIAAAYFRNRSRFFAENV